MDFTPFGLTRTQSRVLAALVGLKSATGFALARTTGLARANVYDALDGLVKRGLVSCDRARPARYGVGGADAVVESLSEEFSRNLAVLTSEFGVEKRYSEPSDYKPSASLCALASRHHIVTQATAALDSARREVLGVIGPWAPELLTALGRARERGLSFRVLWLAEPAPDGARLRSVGVEDLRGYWGGLPLALVVDGRETVCAVIRDEDWTGVWAEDAVLVRFIRHLLRRELASVAVARVS